MKRKVVGYCRVSTEEQSREGLSLELQRHKIEAYCELNDLELVRVEEDRGISAKNITGRPGFQRALEAVYAGDADGLVCWKLDRAFRSTTDALTVAERLNKAGKALHSITEQLNTQSAIGEFFFTLMASLAQMERRLIGERTAAAMQRLKEQGKFTGGEAPFGYRHVAGELIPDAEEQRVIAKVRRLRRKKYSIRRIVKALADDGCVNRKGRPFTKTAVERIIRTIEQEAA